VGTLFKELHDLIAVHWLSVEDTQQEQLEISAAEMRERR
jgi:hypothetical protein